MTETKNRWKSVRDRAKWAARGASFVGKVKATKVVWFPPKPVETGKKAASTAEEETIRAAKKTRGAAKKTTGTAKKTRGTARRTTDGAKNVAGGLRRQKKASDTKND